MKQVTIMCPTPSNVKVLTEELLKQPNFPRPVIIRLGSPAYPKVGSSNPIVINSAEAVSTTTDKLMTKKILSGNMHCVVPYAVSLGDMMHYPFILKGRYVLYKNNPSVFYIEDRNDYLATKGLCKGGHYMERIFNYTSEYRLFCTKKEVFLTIKKIKDFPEEIITNCHNSHNIKLSKDGTIKYPKLWSSIQSNALLAMKLIDLDIASIDVSYSSQNDHAYIFHKINTNPLLTTNILPHYVEQINKLIKEKA